MVFLKEFFDKVDFEKKSTNDKKHENYPVGKEAHFNSLHAEKLFMILCLLIFFKINI